MDDKGEKLAASVEEAEKNVIFFFFFQFRLIKANQVQVITG